MPADLVFVLGAGAACDYGLPLGRDLLFHVHSLASNDQFRRSVVLHGSRVTGDSGEDAHMAVHQIAAHAKLAGVGSIDRFLMERPKLAPYGKILIARSLLRFEKSSNIGIEPALRWYEYLWNMTYARFKAGTLSIAIITLNYDRSLEQFLRTAVASLWNAEEPAADLAVEKQLPVLHLHGDLGPLASVPYGGRGHDDPADAWEEAARAAVGIRLLGEPDTDDRYARASNLLASAKRVCFLGLGYHEEIMQPLVPLERWSQKGQTHPAVFASTLGLSATDLARARSSLNWIAGPSSPNLHSGGCLETLQAFGVVQA